MDNLPNCPKCNSEYTYEDGNLLVCPECAYEWAPGSEAENGDELVVKDANGKQLGYFANLANAKALCDKNPGSKVYDSNNNVIHSNSNAKNTLYVNLYPVRSSWNVYPTDKAPISGNQCGSLNPLAYGGLSYEVLKSVGNDVYHIRTQNYGLVSIYVPNDNEGCVSTTKMY